MVQLAARPQGPRLLPPLQLSSDQERFAARGNGALHPAESGGREVLQDPEEWPWSSYRATIGKEPAPRFLNSDWLLTEFGVGIGQARANFAAFIRAAE